MKTIQIFFTFEYLRVINLWVLKLLFSRIYLTVIIPKIIFLLGSGNDFKIKVVDPIISVYITLKMWPKIHNNIDIFI